MSALGLATLGVQCDNRALGMASLGVFCGETQQVPRGSPELDYRRPLTDTRRILREDEEVLAIIASFMSMINE